MNMNIKLFFPVYTQLCVFSDYCNLTGLYRFSFASLQKFLEYCVFCIPFRSRAWEQTPPHESHGAGGLHAEASDASVQQGSAETFECPTGLKIGRDDGENRERKSQAVCGNTVKTTIFWMACY